MFADVRFLVRAVLLVALIAVPSTATKSFADSISDNPIVFVTMVPNPSDFGTLAATFANHVANPNTAYRGGDLWIRYADGTLKNLTQAAGYGVTGMQGATGIAVRDPAAHWDGSKIIFSMVVGAPTAQYQVGTFRWQLYEITGLGSSDTPVITKVANQPASYNNVAPVYGSDDSIIFVSDRPRDDSVLHTYPQRDEYESTAINSGLWKLSSSGLVILDHSPSGNFNPIIDSYGRVIFTRWDHLQRDQQNVGVDFGAYNFANEASTTPLSSAPEQFPEARNVNDPDYVNTVNLFTINQFFPWMMNQDGTDLETLNHIGRQEIGNYIERSFNTDSNVQEFYSQYQTGANTKDFTLFLHIKEDPTNPGLYLGTSCPEFGSHSGGQVISITGAPGLNPDSMVVDYLTHPDTANTSNSPSVNHSGLYREPLPLSNGKLVAVHTSETRTDSNIGTSAAPLSRYDYRLKLLSKTGSYYLPSTPLTAGITKSVSFWNPDQLVSYNGNLWEMMPVELSARTRPSAPSATLPAIEASVLSDLGVSLGELQSYLRENKLALVVSRNLTSRDKNDRQQPTNLRVAGTTTQALPNSGKIYDISLMQFFQGDLIRGYSNGNTSGRRVLAQKMHSVPDGINPPGQSTLPEGSVEIGSDGSMAAFVPAGRALSWQLLAPDHSAVVRERYWLTFQPGEVRVCASCHGVNTTDHLAGPAPTNKPLALANLLAHWKGLPSISPTPTPGGGGGDGEYEVTLSKSAVAKKGIVIDVTAPASSSGLTLQFSIGKLVCSDRYAVQIGSEGGARLRTKVPNISGKKLKAELLASTGAVLGQARRTIKRNKADRGTKQIAAAKACEQLIRGIRAM